jgi:hypothetical protein
MSLYPGKGLCFVGYQGKGFITNSIFFIVVGISVTQFVITNFAAPLNAIIQALKDTRRGNFEGSDAPIFISGKRSSAKYFHTY